ncbi:MAG: PP2C family protein-serine/threonine phosphatase [Acidobacteriota bacterium]
MMKAIAWRTTPVRARIVFLLAVFFVFASFGFASDMIDMGGEQMPRFVGSVLVSGVFAVCYAAGGVVLRRSFWKIFFPLITIQVLAYAWLGYRYPDVPRPTDWSAAEIGQVHGRLAIDGTFVIAFVCLGYIGFVWVSVSEARRHMKAEAEKAQLESEMAAAREIQRVMVPERLPEIAGYRLESTYRPAAEVGGDFFQVIPLASGRTLVVIGDVSGKGLRAAMIVSMIVGMLRTASGFSEEPAVLLGELNRGLCGRTDGGFATCLMVRLDASGALTVGNAGHPSAYINGDEIPFDGSVPLGLMPESVYAQADVQMRQGDVAMLLTDGVAEAQDAQRVLLGFSRVERLLREGADAKTVADTAQQFGQQDDLTVISIARIAGLVRGAEPVLAS